MATGDDKIQEIVQQKVAHYITKHIPEEEWDKMVREQIDQLINGPRKRELQQWIKEELDKRVKRMIASQMADASYWGHTWGEPAGLFKEVVAEHADKIIEKMFEGVFQNMAQAMKNALGTY